MAGADWAKAILYLGILYLSYRVLVDWRIISASQNITNTTKSIGWQPLSEHQINDIMKLTHQ